jgi:hypothetical protein
MSNWNTLKSDEGATFEPWTDGHAVGFKVTAPGKPDMYVYLVPSLGTDTQDINDSDVFLYRGEWEQGGEYAEPVCYINIWDDEGDSKD